MLNFKRNVMESLKEKLYLKLKKKEKTWKPSVACYYRGPILEQETQNVPLLGWLCVLFFFFCLQLKSEKRCASRTQLTAATAMQLSRLESPQTPNT